MDDFGYVLVGGMLILVVVVVALNASPSRGRAVEYVDPPGAAGRATDDEAAAAEQVPWVEPVSGLAVKVAGRQLSCEHRGGTEFRERAAQLNTPAATFFGFDWANRTATCFVCVRCGRVEWFLL